MRILPREGVLRKLYQDAPASWGNKFIVVYEFPPNNPLTWVDIVVREYSQDHNILTSIVFTERKKLKDSRREVEEQADDAARLAIEQNNLAGVYAMTTVGTGFRIWYMSAEA
ncbi:hypothetical protein GGR51DRAFT_567292 [Nemania sp. FL0031]|nr:hypothetical protein GGR51DRAFT_567292 [Nemania sp. FL0031]